MARQFVKYTFFKIRPEWLRLPAEERQRGKTEFVAVLEDFASKIPVLRTYSTVGTRGDTDLLVWTVSERLEDFQDLMARIRSTALGPYLDTPYSFLAMTKRSIYVQHHRHPKQEGTRERLRPVGAKYLFVYPFVKTTDWYKLPMSERQAMMDEHISLGHKYPSVRINTTYSFGLDDQEFVVAFETDNPADFLDLVMEMREAKAREYTLRDTPIFTCVAMSPGEAVDALGG